MPDKTVILLKLVGFEENEVRLFESILSLAENKLEAQWRVSNFGNMDFYLIPNKLYTAFAQNKELQTIPRKQCIFCALQQGSVSDNILLVDKNNTPSIRSLIELFNKITTNKEEATPFIPPDSGSKEPTAVKATSAAVAKKVAASQNKEEFDPFTHFFIRHLLSEDQNFISFGLKNNDEIYINLQTETYFSLSSLEQLQAYFVASDNLSIQVVDENQLDAFILKHALKPNPLSNLLWYSVFISSQGKIIKGYQENDIVRLKRWPDINLPGCQKLIKLAAYMQSNAVNLKTVEAATDFSQDQIYNFYNACKVIRLIELCQQNEIHQKEIADDRKLLFKKISNRLNK